MASKKMTSRMAHTIEPPGARDFQINNFTALLSHIEIMMSKFLGKTYTGALK
jgi:hypothetical protein